MGGNELTLYHLWLLFTSDVKAGDRSKLTTLIPPLLPRSAKPRQHFPVLGHSFPVNFLPETGRYLPEAFTTQA
jgi:hypothetical protein